MQGAVVELNDKTARLSDGLEVVFEYAIICSGSGYSDRVVKARQASLAERKKTIDGEHLAAMSCQGWDP